MSGQENEYDKQRRHAYHQSALSQADEGGEAAEILHSLSNIEDLPIEPKDDPVMGQLVSKLTSTANLSKEDVRSNKWVREYILVLYLCQYPTDEGMSGSWRGWAHGDRDSAREALDPEKRMMLEAFVSNSKLALSRSEDFKAVEEATRNVSESVVRDGSGNESSGGILGKLRS